MIAAVRVRDRRYMFYAGALRAAEKFHFSGTGCRRRRRVAVEACGLATKNSAA